MFSLYITGLMIWCNLILHIDCQAAPKSDFYDDPVFTDDYELYVSSMYDYGFMFRGLLSGHYLAYGYYYYTQWEDDYPETLPYEIFRTDGSWVKTHTATSHLELPRVCPTFCDSSCRVHSTAAVQGCRGNIGSYYAAFYDKLIDVAVLEYIRGWFVVTTNGVDLSTQRLLRFHYKTKTSEFPGISLVSDDVKYIPYRLEHPLVVNARTPVSNYYTVVQASSESDSLSFGGRLWTLPRVQTVATVNSKLLDIKTLEIGLLNPHTLLTYPDDTATLNEVLVQNLDEMPVMATHHTRKGRLFEHPLPLSVVSRNEPGNCYKAMRYGSWGMTPMCLHHVEQFTYFKTEDDAKIIAYGFSEDGDAGAPKFGGAVPSGIKSTYTDAGIKRYCFINDNTWTTPPEEGPQYQIPEALNSVVNDICQVMVMDMTVPLGQPDYNIAPAVKTITTLVNGWNKPVIVKFNYPMFGDVSSMHEELIRVHSEIYTAIVPINFKVIVDYGVFRVEEAYDLMTPVIEYFKTIGVKPMFQFHLQWMDDLWLIPATQEKLFTRAIEYGVYAAGDEMVLGENMRRIDYETFEDSKFTDYTGSCPGAWKSESRSERSWSLKAKTVMDPRSQEIIEAGALVKTVGPRITGLREWLGGDTVIIFGMNTAAVRHTGQRKTTENYALPESIITDVKRLNRHYVLNEIYKGSVDSRALCDRMITECCSHKLSQESWVSVVPFNEITPYLDEIALWGLNHISIGYLNSIYINNAAATGLMTLIMRDLHIRPISVYYLNYPINIGSPVVDCPGVFKYINGIFLRYNDPSYRNTRHFYTVPDYQDYIVALYDPDLCRNSLLPMKEVPTVPNVPTVDRKYIIDMDTLDLVDVASDFELLEKNLLFKDGDSIYLYTRLTEDPPGTLNGTMPMYPGTNVTPVTYTVDVGKILIPSSYSVEGALVAEYDIYYSLPTVPETVHCANQTSCYVYMDMIGAVANLTRNVIEDVAELDISIRGTSKYAVERRSFARTASFREAEWRSVVSEDPLEAAHELVDWSILSDLYSSTSTGTIFTLKMCAADPSACSIANDFEGQTDWMTDVHAFEASADGLVRLATYALTSTEARQTYKTVDMVRTRAERRPCAFVEYGGVMETGKYAKPVDYCNTYQGLCQVDCGSCINNVCKLAFDNVAFSSAIGRVTAPAPVVPVIDYMFPSETVNDEEYNIPTVLNFSDIDRLDIYLLKYHDTFINTTQMYGKNYTDLMLQVNYTYDLFLTTSTGDTEGFSAIGISVLSLLLSLFIILYLFVKLQFLQFVKLISK